MGRFVNISRCNTANNVSNCAYDNSCGVIPLFNKELTFEIQKNNDDPINTTTVDVYLGDIVSITAGNFISQTQTKDGKKYYQTQNSSVFNYINTGGYGTFEVIGDLPPELLRGNLIETGKMAVQSGTPQNIGTWSGKISRPPNSKKPSSTGKPGVKTTWIYKFIIRLKYTDPKNVVIFQDKEIQFTILERTPPK